MTRMITLNRKRIQKTSQGLVIPLGVVDISWGSGSQKLKAFMPETLWTLGYKNYTAACLGLRRRYANVRDLTSTEYVELYCAKLDEATVDDWKYLRSLAVQDSITLGCYCHNGTFCHTHVIICYACRRWPRAFWDGRADYNKVIIELPAQLRLPF